MLNTSPTVKASYFSKVDFFRSSNSSPTPSTLSTIFQQLARPSFPSGAKSGKFRSFLMFMIASIRKPERPFSSHQLIILYSSCRNFGFSQFRSGCSFICPFPVPFPNSFLQNRNGNCSVDCRFFPCGNKNNPQTLHLDQQVLSETTHVYRSND